MRTSFSIKVTQVLITLVIWELLRCVLSRLRHFRCKRTQATLRTEMVYVRPQCVYMLPKAEKAHARKDCPTLRKSAHLIEERETCKLCFHVRAVLT